MSPPSIVSHGSGLSRVMSPSSLLSHESGLNAPPSLVSHTSSHREMEKNIGLRRFPTRTSTDSCLPTPRSFSTPLSPTEESFDSSRVRRSSSIRYGPRSRTSSFNNTHHNNHNSNRGSVAAFNPGAVGVGFDRPELRSEFLGRHQREFPDRHVRGSGVSEEVFMEQQRSLQDTKIDGRANLYWAQIYRLRRGLPLPAEEPPPSRRLRTLSLIAARASRAASLRNTVTVGRSTPKRGSVASVPNVTRETASLDISLDTSTRRTRSLVEVGSPVTPPRRPVVLKAEVHPATPVESSPAESEDSKALVVQTPDSLGSSFADTSEAPSGRWSGDPSMLSLTSMDRYFPPVDTTKTSMDRFFAPSATADNDEHHRDVLAHAHAMDRLNGRSTVDRFELEIGWLETVERLQKDQRRKGGRTDIDFANCATQLFPPSETASEAPSSPRASSVTSPRITRTRASKLRYSLGSAFSPGSSLYRSERSASLATNHSNYPRTAPTSASPSTAAHAPTGRPSGLGIAIPTPAAGVGAQSPEDTAFVATSAWHGGATEGALQTGFRCGEEESPGDRGAPGTTAATGITSPKKSPTTGSRPSFADGSARRTAKLAAMHPKKLVSILKTKQRSRQQEPVARTASARPSPPSSRRIPSTRSGPTPSPTRVPGFSRFLATCSARLRSGKSAPGGPTHRRQSRGTTQSQDPQGRLSHGRRGPSASHPSSSPIHENTLPRPRQLRHVKNVGSLADAFAADATTAIPLSSPAHTLPPIPSTVAPTLPTAAPALPAVAATPRRPARPLSLDMTTSPLMVRIVPSAALAKEGKGHTKHGSWSTRAAPPKRLGTRLGALRDALARRLDPRKHTHPQQTTAGTTTRP